MVASDTMDRVTAVIEMAVTARVAHTPTAAAIDTPVLIEAAEAEPTSLEARALAAVLGLK